LNNSMETLVRMGEHIGQRITWRIFIKYLKK
jgi:hypothetical protein